ncbi:hypothetical protein [Paraburkholderia ultramafica]|uniref:hypothetical protein n=1 Tax=Paraburkholderia ultramafica TaxID=1544867 RepID=UPI001583B642|nr:hypothetical protein [Paraburkholderia ultramafica]
MKAAKVRDVRRDMSRANARHTRHDLYPFVPESLATAICSLVLASRRQQLVALVAPTPRVIRNHAVTQFLLD